MNMKQRLSKEIMQGMIDAINFFLGLVVAINAFSQKDWLRVVLGFGFALVVYFL